MKKLLLLACSAFVWMPSMSFAELPCAELKSNAESILLDSTLDEISGMAVSRSNAQYIWTHTDSGGKPELYVLDHAGKHVHTFAIEGAVNTDWEDIALGPCAVNDDKTCIYIGDTGDNRYKRKDKKILVVEEPRLADDLTLSEKPDKLKIRQTIPVVFPETTETDAKFVNPDCESLMVDPRNADIYVVSKQSYGGLQSLYKVPRSGKDARLEYIASYKFIGGLGVLTKLYNAVTGADFAPDGKHFVIRSYAEVYEYDLTEYPTVAEAFLHPVARFTTSELQGESIAYDADGKSMMSSGESVATQPALMHFYKCVSEPVMEGHCYWLDANTQCHTAYFAYAKYGRVNLIVNI